jgi:hypothetical protein
VLQRPGDNKSFNDVRGPLHTQSHPIDRSYHHVIQHVYVQIIIMHACSDLYAFYMHDLISYIYICSDLYAISMLYLLYYDLRIDLRTVHAPISYILLAG